MPKYRFIVSVPEVHYSSMLVTAENRLDAIRKVADGQGECIHVEYSHTLDTNPEDWNVEDV